MRYVPLLIAALGMTGCQEQPPAPAPVKAADLAKSYRDHPEAGKAYDGRVVLLGLSNPVRRGAEIHWHLASPDKPAVVVCQFEGEPPPVAPTLWLTGTCRGRVHDGKAREFAGYDFHVVVTGCRVSGPPGR